MEDKKKIRRTKLVRKSRIMDLEQVRRSKIQNQPEIYRI